MTKVRKLMKKMLVLGEASVGKTSLIRRFVMDRFDDKYIATIGTKTSAKELKFATHNEMIKINLQIWDILGQKGYSKLHRSSFQGTNGVFMVADITRKYSLQSLENYWIPKVQHLVGTIPFIILANKIDLINKAELSREELIEFAYKYNVPFYFTSAKNGNNVDQAFYTMGKIMLELKGVEPQRPSKPKIIHPRLLFGDQKGEITRLIDKIIDDFCRDFNSLEDAMPVVRRQFELAELDVNNPTVEALRRFVERLAAVEMNIKKKDIAKADFTKRLKWIEDMERGLINAN
jgi:small GTP-binding protein